MINTQAFMVQLFFGFRSSCKSEHTLSVSEILNLGPRKAQKSEAELSKLDFRLFDEIESTSWRGNRKKIRLVVVSYTIQFLRNVQTFPNFPKFYVQLLRI